MKVEKSRNWLSKNLFSPDQLGNPILLSIEAFEQEKSAKGYNRRIVGKHQNGKSYCFDIWGDTLNYLIDNLGDETDKWIGTKIKVMLVMRGDKELKNVTL